MFGLQEFLIPLGILLIILIFGARRIGDIGSGLGAGIRNFRKAMRDDDTKPTGSQPKDPE